MDLNKNFWRNKRVFLTGFTGFKGAWATLILNKLGAEVFGFSLKPDTNPNLFEIFKLKKIINYKISDIRNFKSLKKEIINFQPDIILHFASKALVRYSYHNPVETYSTNVMGLLNLFEASRLLNKKNTILNVTSDKCYFNNQKKKQFLKRVIHLGVMISIVHLKHVQKF